jgi:hypothetical protein
MISAANHRCWQIRQLHQLRLDLLKGMFDLIEVTTPKYKDHSQLRVIQPTMYQVANFWERLKFIPVVLLVSHIQVGTLLLLAQFGSAPFFLKKSKNLILRSDILG